MTPNVNAAALKTLMAGGGQPAVKPAAPRQPAGRVAVPRQPTWDWVRQVISANPEAEPGFLYDTLLMGAHQYAGNSAAVNFANIGRTTPFFSTRTVNTAGEAVTNIGDNNKVTADMVVQSIAVEIGAYLDGTNAAGDAAGYNFVETIVQYGVLEFKVPGGRPFLRAPVSRFPAGGGVFVSFRQAMQAIAADRELGIGNNGYPTPQAQRALKKAMRFKKGDAFQCNLLLPVSADDAHGPMKRIQALTPLAGENTAHIRIILEGIVGSDRLDGRLRGLSAGMNE